MAILVIAPASMSPDTRGLPRNMMTITWDMANMSESSTSSRGVGWHSQNVGEWPQEYRDWPITASEQVNTLISDTLTMVSLIIWYTCGWNQLDTGSIMFQ